MKLIVSGGGPAGLTAAVGMAAQKLVRELGLATLPQLWSDIK